MAKTVGTKKETAALVREFIEPPFSVLQTMTARWMKRKRAWKAIGLRSELGRGEVVTKDGRIVQGKGKEILPGGGGGSHTKTAYLRTKGKAVPSGSPMPINSEAGTSTWRGDRVGGQNVRKHGRSKAPAFNSGVHGADPIKVSKKLATGRTMGEDLMRGENDKFGGPDEETLSGTSIFDPVLCEVLYRWYAGKGSKVLDPFAGGSVRGIIAGVLGHTYRGLELRGEQVKANRLQLVPIADRFSIPTGQVKWVQGDSYKVLKKKSGGQEWADFILSCPPYVGLERYSDDPADLSTMDYEAFNKKYRAIIRHSLDMLKPNRFAAWVIGHVRDPKDPGMYSRFIRDTIDAFETNGVYLYNQTILVTAIGSLPIRSGPQMRATGKLGSHHQYALIFLKGDGHKAREAMPINSAKLPFLLSKSYDAPSLFKV